LPSRPDDLEEVDILAFGAHPDDVDLAVGGTLLLAHSQGYVTGIVDLTRGELGTRGTPEIRAKEAAIAAELLHVSTRDNLDLGDGGILPTEEVRRALVRILRRRRPTLVLGPLERDLHPDHAWAGRTLKDACFLAGIAKYDPVDPPHRPSAYLGYLSHTEVPPSLVIDITPYFEAKRQACLAYRSQFYNPASQEPATYISRPEFWQWWEARARHAGHTIGAQFGEAFHFEGPSPVHDPIQQFSGFGYYPVSKRTRHDPT
jgi:bacillithiol biosynthesis deacetylase BshB1